MKNENGSAKFCEIPTNFHQKFMENLQNQFKCMQNRTFSPLALRLSFAAVRRISGAQAPRVPIANERDRRSDLTRVCLLSSGSFARAPRVLDIKFCFISMNIIEFSSTVRFELFVMVLPACYLQVHPQERGGGPEAAHPGEGEGGAEGCGRRAAHGLAHCRQGHGGT